MGVDAEGRTHPLSESLVLATILCAVDAERTRHTFVWSRPGEVLEAVSSVYWPLLVVRAPGNGRVAIFDGTGVWNQTFRHSKMPGLDVLRKSLQHVPPSSALAAGLRELRAPLLYEGVPDSMKVEGLVPVNLPLLADILAQSGFRTEPVAPHAGFLPARHPIGWYEATVAHIGESLERFDAEIGELRETRAAVVTFLASASGRLDAERRQLQFELTSRSRVYAHAEMERDLESVHASIREQLHAELDRIRTANVAIAEARAMGKLGGLLAQRATARRQDASELKARLRAASEAERQATKEIREARARMESLHERERDSFAVLTDRVAVVEQHAADELSAQELLRDDAEAAGSELVAALDAVMQRRVSERDQLASHFLVLPGLAGAQTLWFPLWIATLVGPHGARSVVFPPMRVRDGMRVGDSIKTLFGGVVLPLEPRTAQFGQGLRTTLETTIASDPWLAGVTREIVRAADATADPEFLQRLARGLQELRVAGWISADQERRYFDASSQHLRSRPMGNRPIE
jgi:hypothetical protein